MGDHSRTCLLNGVWSGLAPVCEAIKCVVLPSLTNGIVNYINGTGFNSVVTYDCNDGYDLVRGDISRTCQSDGLWSGKMPACEAVDCGLLNTTTFINGRIQYTGGTTVGFEGTYFCNNGFTLSDSNGTRICQANGTWSGIEPRCNVVDCGDLPNPSNGVVMHTAGTTFLSLAHYMCDDNFTLVGEEFRECSGSGVWTGIPPTCLSIYDNVTTHSATTAASSSNSFSSNSVSLLISVFIAMVLLISV